jgi:hypothetical protein
VVDPPIAVSIYAKIRDGLLDSLELNTLGIKSQDYTLSLLKEKFGEPSYFEEIPYQNSFGAKFIAYYADWDSQNVHVHFDAAHSGKLNEGWVRMDTPRRYDEVMKSSFLRGASSCEELFATAAVMGVEALAVVDRNSLAGVVRAHEAAKTTGVRLVVGCRLDLTEGYSVLVYPTDRPAYSRLCRLLSLGKKRAGKARCELSWPDLVAYREGLIAVLVLDEADEDCAMRLTPPAGRLRRSRLYGTDPAPPT